MDELEQLLTDNTRELLAAAAELFDLSRMSEEEAIELGARIWSDKWVFEVGYELLCSADRKGEAKPDTEERIWRRENDPGWFPVLTAVHFATDAERAALCQRVSDPNFWNSEYRLGRDSR